MQASLNQQIKYLQVTLKACPMQGIRFHLFICAQDYVVVLGFGFEVGEMGVFGEEEFYHFGVVVATGPDQRIPFLLRILYTYPHSIPVKYTSAFFFKHFSASSKSFLFTAANILSFRICLFF